MANYNRKRKGSAVSVIAVILGLLLIVSVVLGCGTYFGGWFSKDEEDPATEEQTEEATGFVVNEQSSNGLKLTGVAVEAASGASYISSYTITATVEPSTATDQTVTWSLAWASSSSATISDYVTLSSTTSTSGSSITVYCLQAFRTQIVLTATTDGFTSDLEQVTATATLDFVKPYTNFYYEGVSYSTDFILDSSVSAYDGTNNILTKDSVFNVADLNKYIIFSSGTGTVEDGCSGITLKFELTSEFISALKNVNSSFASYATTYSRTLSSSNIVITMDNLFAFLFGGNATTDISSSYPYLCSAFETCYNNGNSILTVAATVTGTKTGQTYTLSCNCYMDPDGWYTNVTAATLNDTQVYFY